MTKEKISHNRWKLLLILYSTIMLCLLFGRSFRNTEGLPYWKQLLHNSNFKPFHIIGKYISCLSDPQKQHLRLDSIVNLAGNILLFIPAGFLFPKVWPFLRKFFVFLAFCTGVILLVESTQVFTLLGNFDVDDLILNLFGMCLGFGLFKISARR